MRRSLLFLMILSLQPITARAIETNLLSTNWVDRFRQVVEGTRERAFATQFRPWSDLAGAEPVGGPFDVPLITFTNVGGWTTDGAAPGFVRFDTNIIEILTQSVFEMGQDHPQMRDRGFLFQIASEWETSMRFVYRVPPPFRFSIPVVSNAGRFIISLETNAFSGRVVTNTGLALVTNYTTAVQKNIIRLKHIAEIDQTLYRLLGWYGDSLANQESNFYFRVFDDGLSYQFFEPGGETELDPMTEPGGPLNAEVSEGITSRRARDSFAEWGVGDTNTGYFTRTPSGAFTNIMIAEMVFTITNSFSNGGVETFVAGWKPNALIDRIFLTNFPTANQSPVGRDQFSFNLEGTVSNRVILPGPRPVLTFTPQDTNNTDLGTAQAIIIIGQAVNRTNNIAPEIWTEETFTNTPTIFDVDLTIDVPYSSVTTFTNASAPVTSTNRVIDRLGDSIRLEWRVLNPKFGAVAFPIFRSDINERYVVLSNMHTTAFHFTDNINNNTTLNEFNSLVEFIGSNYVESQTVVVNNYRGTTNANSFPQFYSAVFNRAGNPTLGYDIELRHIAQRQEAEFFRTNWLRTVRFVMSATRVFDTTPQSPGGFVVTNDPSAEYDAQGSVFTNEGRWYVTESTNLSGEASLIYTSTVFVSDVNLGTASAFPVDPGEGNTGTRGFQVIGRDLGGSNGPNVLIDWTFTNAVKPILL